MTRDSPVRRIPFLWFSPTWVIMTVFLSQLCGFRECFSGICPVRENLSPYISTRSAKCHPCECIGAILYPAIYPAIYPAVYNEFFPA